MAREANAPRHPVADTGPALAAVARAIADADGPVAVDVERAGSFRYSQRAYLIQLKRGPGPPHLVDPIAVPDVDALRTALAGSEWTLHAADQDLPSLGELGLRPSRLFDTEIAARLLGKPRVGLAALVEAELGVTLPKTHSAADWSRRPLPDAWIRYAADDVEHLIDLRSTLAAQLEAAGRSGWAAAEFERLTVLPMPHTRAEPWRRTAGTRRMRNRRQLAIVRALWEARDEVAMREDRAPFRILPNDAIAAAATARPASMAELSALEPFRHRAVQRRLARWWDAVERARALPDDLLPAGRPAEPGPPSASSWPRRNPPAAARIAAARAAIRQMHDDLGIPTENLLPPDAVRSLCWHPPADLTAEAVGQALAAAGARAWQIELCAAPVAAALVAGQAPAASPPAVMT